MTPFDQFIRSRDLDTRELARLAKVSEAFVARLRDGRSKPSGDEMRRISEACSWITGDRVYTWELFESVR